MLRRSAHARKGAELAKVDRNMTTEQRAEGAVGSRGNGSFSYRLDLASGIVLEPGAGVRWLRKG